MATFAQILLMRTKNDFLLSLLLLTIKALTVNALTVANTKAYYMRHACASVLSCSSCLIFLHMTRNKPQNTHFTSLFNCFYSFATVFVRSFNSLLFTYIYCPICHILFAVALRGLNVK